MALPEKPHAQTATHTHGDGTRSIKDVAYFHSAGASVLIHSPPPKGLVSSQRPLMLTTVRAFPHRAVGNGYMGGGGGVVIALVRPNLKQDEG